jgi:hypothetical protein
MPVQAVGRLASHGFDRRQIFGADMARLQQSVGGGVAGLDQQRYRAFDQFGATDGVAVGQRPAGRDADGVLQFGAVALRRHMPAESFGGLAFGGGGGHGGPPAGDARICDCHKPGQHAALALCDCHDRVAG